MTKWLPLMFFVSFVTFGIGMFVGAWVQYDSGFAKPDKYTEGYDDGKRLCANHPTFWDCLSPDQQEAARAYAKEHTGQ